MQYLVETDVLFDFLKHRDRSPSLLRRALALGTCYTTMLNAMEVYAECSGDVERTAATNMLMVVRVLGFNGRFAEPFAELSREYPGVSQREMFVLGMARASKLTVLTRAHFDRYAALGAAPVVSEPEAVPANVE